VHALGVESSLINGFDCRPCAQACKKKERKAARRAAEKKGGNKIRLLGARQKKPKRARRRSNEKSAELPRGRRQPPSGDIPKQRAVGCLDAENHLRRQKERAEAEAK
jgi:hypothetical protein